MSAWIAEAAAERREVGGQAASERRGAGFWSIRPLAKEEAEDEGECGFYGIEINRQRLSRIA